MNPSVQRQCLWCGLGMMGFVFMGLLFAHWFPPPSPHDSAATVSRAYSDHATGIRIGALLIGLGGTLLGPFAAVLSAQIRRIEGHGAPLAYLQLCMAALWIAGIIMPTLFWMGASFEPAGTDPGTIRALHAAGWLPFVAVVFPLMAVFLTVAVATFTDGRADPVFPRWVGYLNLWIALLLLPGVLVLFFRTGPFAWNGILTFWLAAGAVTIWLVAMIVVLRRAIDQQVAEEGSSPGSSVWTGPGLGVTPLSSN
jgi:hypothetical protein